MDLSHLLTLLGGGLATYLLLKMTSEFKARGAREVLEGIQRAVEARKNTAYRKKEQRKLEGAREFDDFLENLNSEKVRVLIHDREEEKE